MTDELGGPITTAMAMMGFIGMALLLVEVVIAAFLGHTPLINNDAIYVTTLLLLITGVGLHGLKPEWGI